MFPKLQTVHKPGSEKEALALLAREGVRIMPLYGGPELFDKLDVAAEVDEVVSLAALGLDEIQPLEDAAIGAMVPLRGLRGNEVFNRVYRALPRQLRMHAWPAVFDAAERSYPLNLGNMWTVGAVVAHAGASSPFLVTLLALGALVEVAGKRRLPLADYLPRRALTDLITGVALPMGTEKEESVGIVFEEVARTPKDEPIVCAAARAVVEDGVITSVRLALGGVAPAAIRAAGIEAALAGKPANAESIDAALSALDGLQPPADFRGSTEYRREMAKVLARRALLRALAI